MLNLHLVPLRTHLLEVTRLDEHEFSHEFRHPLHIVGGLMRYGQGNSLYNASGTVLQVLAAIDILVAAFHRIARVNGTQQAIYEALGDTLTGELGMNVELQLHGITPHAALVAKVVQESKADDFVRHVTSSWVARADASIDGDDVGKLLASDIVHAVQDLICIARLEFRHTVGIGNIPVVDFLNKSAISSAK